ncbi:MAG: M28 family peptidase [Myxococcales bacterium]|nr:M28 family peptidase [Myxococcales bacterium]
MAFSVRTRWVAALAVGWLLAGVPACSSAGGDDAADSDEADGQKPPIDSGDGEDGDATPDGGATPAGDGDRDDVSTMAPAPGAFDFDDASYRADLEFITGEREPGSEHWQAVQDMCAERLTDLGFDVTRPAYETGVNVLGTMIGEGAPDELVIVGAHYDHIPGCPGADDNATAVAGALELARLLGGEMHARTLVIACWDEEELGLLGSAAHAGEIAESGMEVAVAISLEMIGFASDEPDTQMVPVGFDLAFPEAVAAVRDNDLRGDFITYIGNEPAAGTLELLGASADALPLPSITLQATEALGPVLANLVRSDHASFWLNGAPGVMITDSANFRNPNYHCQNGEDTIDTLDLDFAASVVVTTTAAVERELNP